MNYRIPLYQLTRSGVSILLARLENVGISPGEPGQQRVDLSLHVDVVLFGEQGGPLRRADFSQPVSQTARLKYPDPLWGRVALEEGRRVLIATSALDETPTDPLYVDEVAEPSDPVYDAVRDVLAQERSEVDTQARRDRYVTWLIGDESVAKLFSAEALARQPELADGDPEGYVARAYVSALNSSEDAYLGISLAQFMFTPFYNHVGETARIILLNALIQAAAGDNPNLEDLALDHLTNLSPAELAMKGVQRNRQVANKLQARLEAESSREVRKHLLKLIAVLRGSV